MNQAYFREKGNETFNVEKGSTTSSNYVLPFMVMAFIDITASLQGYNGAELNQSCAILLSLICF